MSIHAAKADKSERLKRILSSLARHGEQGVTSWELMQEAQVVAPSTCVSELRSQGYAIDCTRETRDHRPMFRYRLRAV